MGGRTQLLVFELRIALPDGTLVLTGKMPHLAPIGPAAVSADQLVRKTALTALVPALLGTPLKFLLYQIENFRRDNRRMAVFNVILRNLAIVPSGFLRQEFHRIGLLQ